MRGYPKHIATGEDLYNCLALVQSGELPAAALSESIAALEGQQITTLPILAVSEDRKTVTTFASPDAATGAEVQNAATTIKAAKASATLATVATTGTVVDENTATDEPATVEITLARALPKDADTIKITAAESAAETLGISEDAFTSIKGVLKNYE